MGLTIGEQLAFRGFSVSAFARRVGVKQSTMQRIVTGETDFGKVRVCTAIRIAHGLGLSLEQLYYGDDVCERDLIEIVRIYRNLGSEGRKALLSCACGIERGYASRKLLPDEQFAIQVLQE